MAGLSKARKTAYKVLMLAEERDAYVRELVNSQAGVAAMEKLSDEDAAFVRVLVFGVTAAKGTLDEAIDRFAARPQKMDASVRCALRLATFELLFLKKPAHVAVSQGVELVRMSAKSASGMANAVLRRIAETAEDFMAESPERQYGLPAWLYARLVSQLGEERARKFGDSMLEPAPVYVANVAMWINDEHAQKAFGAAGMSVRSQGNVPGAWQVRDPSRVYSCELVSSDKAVVSDYGAQLVAYLATPDPGDRMLEVGSGRGTKTILMAGHLHRMGGAARIYALDSHEFKTSIATKRLQSARVTGVETITGDALDLDALTILPPLFETALVDAPCSGTGTLRRHPEIVWKLTEDDVESCAELQLRMLRSVAPRIARGGKLVYSTCSMLSEEDELVVKAFLASEEGACFSVEAPSQLARSKYIVDELERRTTPDGFLRTYPEPGGCDGHFCACLRKGR